MHYDLIIIGTGTAAMVAAMRVRDAGWTVAVVDEKPFGGTCALRGCDPKKMLVSGAEVIDAERRMSGHGIDGDLRIDWPELIGFKRTFTDPVPEKHEHRYRNKGIDTLHGAAQFTGPNTLKVDAAELSGRHVLIASGAAPVPLGIAGEDHLVDNEFFLAMEQLPRRIVLVGGGYIAAEFSNIAARAGAKVTVIQRGSRMLTHFEPELVGWLTESFDSIGVQVMRYRYIRADVEASGAGSTDYRDRSGPTRARTSSEEGRGRWHRDRLAARVCSGRRRSWRKLRQGRVEPGLPSGAARGQTRGCGGDVR